MMALTHVAVGTLAYAGLATLFGGDISGAALGAAALGSLLPDVDTSSSRAGFCVYPLALWLERKFGHRTVTHSITGIGVCALVFSPLLFFVPLHPLFIALVCGFCIHLAGDACTKAGIPLMWPRRERWVFPGDAKFRLKTGSLAEWVVLGVVLAIAALTLPVARMGPRRWLHVVRGDIGSAVRDQQDYAGRFATEADVEGYDVLTHKLVSGRFPVAGLQGDDGLLIQREGALWMVSKSATSADPFRIEPRHVRVYAVRPLETRQETLLASNITLSALADRIVTPIGAMPPPWERPAHEDFTVPDIRVSGVAHCFPFAKGSDAPHDQPNKPGIKRVEFGGGDLLTLRDANVFDLRSCGGVTIRTASLALTLPKKMPLPKLLFEGATRTVEVPHLGRHADLKAEVGQLVWKGDALGHTFAQTPKHEPTPDELLREAGARAAEKELAGLDAEEAAMRKSELWKQFASAFVQRRAALQKQAGFKVAVPPATKAPSPVVAPFSGVVESIEWEAPTVPTLPGEKPEHTARVALSEVATR
jgi:inner membrane protein